MSYTFSASQINSYMQDPCIWVIQSLFKMKSPMNGYAIRGIVFGEYVEGAAVTGNWLVDPEQIKNKITNDCLKANADLPSLNSIADDWAAISNHFKAHADKGYESPIASQHHFMIDCTHGKLQGYLDLLYSRAGKDIKYRTKIEDKPRISDMIQLSCYWKALGYRQFLTEICKGKVKQSAYGQEELEFYWKIAEHNMGQMKKIANDYQDAVNLLGARQACLSILKGLPIHNPRLYWWPEAEQLILEAIS